MAWKDHGPGGCCCNECCQASGPNTLANQPGLPQQWTITANDAANIAVAGNNRLNVLGDSTPLAAGAQTIYTCDLEATGTVILFPPVFFSPTTNSPGWVLDFVNRRIYSCYGNPATGVLTAQHKPIPVDLTGTVQLKIARRLTTLSPPDPAFQVLETVTVNGVWVASRPMRPATGFGYTLRFINTNREYAGLTFISGGDILLNTWNTGLGTFPGTAALSNMLLCSSKIAGGPYSTCEEIPVYWRWREGGENSNVTATVSGAVVSAANGARTCTFQSFVGQHGFYYAPAEGSQISLGLVTVGGTDYDTWLSAVAITTSPLGPYPQGTASITVRFRESGLIPPPPNDFCGYTFLRTAGFERQIPNASLADIPLTFGFGNANTDFIYASPNGGNRLAVLDATIGRGVTITFSQ